MLIISFHTNIHILDFIILCYILILIFIRLQCNTMKGAVFDFIKWIESYLVLHFHLMCNFTGASRLTIGMGRGLLPKLQMPVVVRGMIFGGMNIFQVLKSLPLYFSSQSHCLLLSEDGNNKPQESQSSPRLLTQFPCFCIKASSLRRHSTLNTRTQVYWQSKCGNPHQP